MQYQQVDGEKSYEQIKAGNLPKALQLYQQVLEEKECQSDKMMIEVVLISIMKKIGIAYEKQQHFVQANNVYQKVLSIAENTFEKKHKVISLILHKLANLSYQLSNYTYAKKLWEDVLVIDQEIYGLESSEVANILIKLAKVNEELDKHAQAKSQLKQALTIYKQIYKSGHDKTDIIKTNLASLYISLGYYTQAESLLKSVLDNCEKTYSSENMACVITQESISIIQSHQGKFKDAESLLKWSGAIKENFYGLEHPYVGDTLRNLANFHASLGDYAKAELLLKRVLVIKEKAYPPVHPKIAETLSDLATIIYKPLGEYEHAETLLKQGFDIYEKFYGPQHTQVAKALSSLADIYEKQGDYEQAKSRYQRALIIYEKIYGPQHAKVAGIIDRLAHIHQRMGDYIYAQAHLLYQRAVSAPPKSKITIVNLAKSYENIGDYAHTHAKLLFKRALGIYESVYGIQHVNVALTVTFLAGAYERLGDYADAESLQLQKALPIAVNSEMPELLSTLQINLSKLFTRQDHHSVAIFFGKQAVNILQNLQENIPSDKTLQRSFVKDNTFAYKYLINLLIEQKRLPEALQILEMFKEEEYFDFTRRRADVRTTQASYTDFEQPWVDRYAVLTQRLAKLEHEKRTLESKPEHGLTDAEKIQFTKLEKDISSAKQSLITFLAELKTAFKQADIKEVTKTPSKAKNNLKALQNTLSKLGHGAVLVYYLILEDKLMIMLVTPDEQIVHHVAINQKHLSEILPEFITTLRNEDEQVREKGLPLYELLIKPIETDLVQAKTKTLMVSLDGPLRYMPIAALHDGKQYMAERYAIVRYTQTTENILQRPSKPTQWRAAGLGVNKKVRKEFPALKGVDEELKRIVCLNENNSDCVFPGNIYLNDKFTATTMQQVLTENYSLLHIASHFKFDSSSELLSFLLLGDGRELTLATIRENYNFNGIDLLTLSACDTAVSVPRNGREIEGFGILAQNKGARGIISTLWLTDNQAAIQFMPKFYRVLTENPELTKAGALQKVQKDFIFKGEYAHPYYWAPFILMGNWL